ncbi:MAG: DUF1801 domain-containing protein [Micropruina sp.]|nr:DUF1801 domain-containing protein [Micropruina sp.]
MVALTVDEYLDALDLPKRETLQEVRTTIRALLPEATEGISYGCPVFRVAGKNVAGFAAFAKHLTYAPHSSTVLEQLPEELTGYKVSKGSFQFKIGEPLPADLLAKLIAVRLAELS